MPIYFLGSVDLKEFFFSTDRGSKTHPDNLAWNSPNILFGGGGMLGKPFD